jgi:hypothetical protein
MTNVFPYVPKAADPHNGGSGSGSGGSDMEQRLTDLEKQMAEVRAHLSVLPAIESKLIEIAGQMAKATEVAEIKGQLSQMPKATEFGHLRGDVSRLAERTTNLPSMWQMMLGFLGIIVAILWKTK